MISLRLHAALYPVGVRDELSLFPLGCLWDEPFDVVCKTCGYRVRVENGDAAQRAAWHHDRTVHW